MRRKVVVPAAAFATLVLVAGSGMAGNKTADTSYTDENEPLSVERCENAWAASPAYGECGDRLQVQQGTAQPESVAMVDNLFAIATSCLHHVSEGEPGGSDTLTATRQNMDWRGELKWTSHVKLCHGELKTDC